MSLIVLLPCFVEATRERDASDACGSACDEAHRECVKNEVDSIKRTDQLRRICGYDFESMKSHAAMVIFCVKHV